MLQIQFGAFRVYAVEKAVKQSKFCSFIWTGPSANIKAKAAATAIKASVLKHFEASARSAACAAARRTPRCTGVRRCSFDRLMHP